MIPKIMKLLDDVNPNVSLIQLFICVSHYERCERDLHLAKTDRLTWKHYQDRGLLAKTLAVSEVAL